MLIETKYHGQVEVKEEELYLFSRGIPGFAEEKQFTLLAFPDNELFYVLQSVKTPALGFIVASPFTFFADYDFHLDDSSVEVLELKQPEDAAVYIILTVHDPFEETTGNLQAPIIINVKSKQGKQVILNDQRYGTRQAIMQAVSEKE